MKYLTRWNFQKSADECDNYCNYAADLVIQKFKNTWKVFFDHWPSFIIIKCEFFEFLMLIVICEDIKMLKKYPAVDLHRGLTACVSFRTFIDFLSSQYPSIREIWIWFLSIDQSKVCLFFQQIYFNNVGLLFSFHIHIDYDRHFFDTTLLIKEWQNILLI